MPDVRKLKITPAEVVSTGAEAARFSPWKVVSLLGWVPLEWRL